MKQKKDDRPMILWARVDRDGRYAHLRFYPMFKGPNGQTEGPGLGHDLEGFEIYDQIGEGSSSEPPRFDYAWTYGFRCYFTELQEAERHVRVLKALEKRLAKLRDQFGPCSTYGEYITRMASALGVEIIEMPSSRFEGQMRETSPGSAISTINELVENEWRRLNGKPSIKEEQAEKDRIEREKYEEQNANRAA